IRKSRGWWLGPAVHQAKCGNTPQPSFVNTGTEPGTTLPLCAAALRVVPLRIVNKRLSRCEEGSALGSGSQLSRRRRLQPGAPSPPSGGWGVWTGPSFHAAKRKKEKSKENKEIRERKQTRSLPLEVSSSSATATMFVG